MRRVSRATITPRLRINEVTSPLIRRFNRLLTAKEFSGFDSKRLITPNFSSADYFSGFSLFPQLLSTCGRVSELQYSFRSIKVSSASQDRGSSPFGARSQPGKTRAGGGGGLSSRVTPNGTPTLTHLTRWCYLPALLRRPLMPKVGTSNPETSYWLQLRSAADAILSSPLRRNLAPRNFGSSQQITSFKGRFHQAVLRVHSDAINGNISRQNH